MIEIYPDDCILSLVNVLSTSMFMSGQSNQSPDLDIFLFSLCAGS